MDDFFELTLPERIAAARVRLEPLAAQLNGVVTLEDADGPAEYEDADDDGLFLIIRAHEPGSGRAVRVASYLIDLSCSVGPYGIAPASEVSLAVEVDNRLGYLDLRLLDEGDDPNPETQQLVSGALYVSHESADGRASMRQSLERLPGLLKLAEAFLRRYERSSLHIGSSVEVNLAWLDDDDDEWVENTRDLGGRIEGLARMAALIETVPIAGFSFCQFCATRFMPGPTATCPHCGAPLG